LHAFDRRDLLLEAGLALSSELSLAVVLQRIVDLSTEVTDARYGALGVIGPDGAIADFITTGLSARTRQSIGHIPVGAGILGVLMHGAAPLRLADISKDPRSVGFPPNHPPMKTFIGAPVKALGRVFGNLYLTEKRGGLEFSDEDMSNLLVLATQAGVAIANASLYEEARHRERWLEGLRKIATDTLAGAEPDDVIDTVCRFARELAEADIAAIVLPDRDGRLLVVAADGAHHADIIGLEVPLDESISGEVILTGKPLLMADASSDERAFQPMVRKAEMGSALFVPLRVGDRALGTLAVANVAGGQALSPDSLNMIETFAEQAAIVYDYGRARRDAQRVAIMDDRERIAKDLHDGIIQSLFAVGMGLQATAMSAGGDVESKLDEAVTEIDRVIRDLRNYIFALRPGLLADRQLDHAVRDLAGKFTERTGVETVVRVEPGVAQALASRSSDIVQFVREALSNVGRHAEASRARVELIADGERALLVVQDDGVGFDIARVRRGQGLGNLDARARRLGGSLRITSRPGRGTRLRAAFPLELGF
jgi:signal transduction histidine kinase